MDFFFMWKDALRNVGVTKTLQLRHGETLNNNVNWTTSVFTSMPTVVFNCTLCLAR
jgi:hypothetical protein